MKHIIALSFIVFTFNSCTKTIEFDFMHQPELTFNCILNPDSVITANLSLSKKLGGNEAFTPVRGAKITLFENDNLLGRMSELANGNYCLEYKPKRGILYRVEIEKEGYPEARAQTTVPTGSEVRFTQQDNPTLERRTTLQINIHDAPGRNYYWYYSYYYNLKLGYKYTGSAYTIYSPYFDSFNKKIEPEIGNGFYYDYMIRINDTSNDNGILEWKTNARVDDRYDDYYVVLETDGHYDEYLKTSIQVGMLENEPVPLNEPVQIYSNVENGYGIFGANVVHVLEL